MNDIVERLRKYRIGCGIHCSHNDSREPLEECIEAADEIERLSARAEKAERDNAKLTGLLCILHRDGGHYIEKHGMDKAIDDAHLVWAELIASAEAAEAANARLREVLKKISNKSQNCAKPCQCVSAPSAAMTLGMSKSDRTNGSKSAICDALT